MVLIFWFSLSLSDKNLGLLWFCTIFGTVVIPNSYIVLDQLSNLAVVVGFSWRALDMWTLIVICILIPKLRWHYGNDFTYDMHANITMLIALCTVSNRLRKIQFMLLTKMTLNYRCWIYLLLGGLEQLLVGCFSVPNVCYRQRDLTFVSTGKGCMKIWDIFIGYFIFRSFFL